LNDMLPPHLAKRMLGAALCGELAGLAPTTPERHRGEARRASSLDMSPASSLEQPSDVEELVDEVVDEDGGVAAVEKVKEGPDSMKAACAMLGEAAASKQPPAAEAPAGGPSPSDMLPEVVAAALHKPVGRWDSAMASSRAGSDLPAAAAGGSNGMVQTKPGAACYGSSPGSLDTSNFLGFDSMPASPLRFILQDISVEVRRPLLWHPHHGSSFS
jgi:hypothetical protein